MQDAGRPFAVTHRSVLGIAVPMTLAYATTPLLGIVDTAVVGQFGDPALIGGLAAGALVFDVVFSSFNFVRSGTTGLVAQAFGRGDEVEQQAVFWRALAIAVVLGLAMLLSAPFVSAAGQRFMGAEPRVSEALDIYVRIRLVGAPLALINFAVLGYVLGRGEGALALSLQLLLNGVNIVLSIALGLWLGWGVGGVAWGTVAGEACAAVVGMAMLAARFRRQERVPRARLLELDALLRMIAINRDIMIRSFALLVAYALFTRQGAAFGTVTLAANAVLMNFFMAMSFFLDGFATAAEQLAGRALGARDASAFRRVVRLTAMWGFGIAGVAVVLVLAFGDALIGLTTTSLQVQTTAAEFLPFAALAALSGVLAFQMDGVYIGATWSVPMRNTMLISLVAMVAAMALLTGPLGNHGLWLSLHAWLLVRGLSLLALLPGQTAKTFQSVLPAQ
ncbi:MAG: MATE family efflux transporter [Rhizobiaceae bacterium]|nr:MATE family efflux transporter [Rhizobiaceae bacterium]